ncbi:hypothetical protein ACGFWD_37500 [Streptomyces sp. NPDC048448]|uniref:Uncharacterized protein n=1 Tax=Streptomyces kaempferi TaxID=333725 RepID=A0ABW3XPW1_9ACTN|nr:hypothetical protein [Streptomyces sp. NBC_01455]
MNDDGSTRDGFLIHDLGCEDARRTPDAALDAEVNSHTTELTDQRTVNAPHLVALVHAGARFGHGHLVEPPAAVAA